MKTPRLDDFSPTTRRPVKELHSPIDDMPRIEKPSPKPRQPSHRQGGSLAVSPHGDVAVSPHRPEILGKRLILRRGFDYYDDQLVALKKLSLQEQIAGRDGSMSRMLRDALDQYLARQGLKPYEK
jgi:hypothetical protein